MGSVCADIVREYGLGDPMRFPPDPDRINANYARLEARARDDLRADGFADDAIVLERSLDFKFRRQVHVVRMPVPAKTLTAEALERLHDEFESTYERRFGRGSAFRAAGTEVVTFRIEGIGRVAKPQLKQQAADAAIPSEARGGTRLAYFVDPDTPATPPVAWEQTPVYRLPGLVAGNRVAGPAIVETPVTTIVLPPRHAATVDAYLNVAIEREASA
jgi:N-methylhydantoinase A